ncbi:hypothetical protein ACRE_017140 [Hapsidospora chrysogenum ATCC 11550]|uniref:Rhomboid family membrane protein n=1 Tax=Hapsidospora chrysogenum (strain ATCC 11550 / CBS 779.69 / DSM 880 / IAM 14645 / JCM 23072 / IMI 49137) TaxID=857340 RepID=A0A086TDE8_HAPC1|nr:hypothetical protein ACRE_017140 [Hapsidospora chrysogenum ATCC 11550]
MASGAHPGTAAPDDQAERFLKNSAIAGAVICPLAMLLPPRKIDVRFFVLASTFSLSTSHLAKVYTGESLYARFQRRANGLVDSATGLPPEAQRTQQLLREHRAAQAAQKQRQADEEEEGRRKAGLAKVVDDVWMGGEDKDWQKKRLEEHQRSFAEGKGMTGIIMDQIADVWSGNWRPDAKKKADGETTADEAKPEKKQ